MVGQRPAQIRMSLRIRDAEGPRRRGGRPPRATPLRFRDQRRIRDPRPQVQCGRAPHRIRLRRRRGHDGMGCGVRPRRDVGTGRDARARTRPRHSESRGTQLVVGVDDAPAGHPELGGQHAGRRQRIADPDAAVPDLVDDGLGEALPEGRVGVGQFEGRMDRGRDTGHGATILVLDCARFVDLFSGPDNRQTHRHGEHQALSRTGPHPTGRPRRGAGRGRHLHLRDRRRRPAVGGTDAVRARRRPDPAARLHRRGRTAPGRIRCAGGRVRLAPRRCRRRAGSVPLVRELPIRRRPGRSHGPARGGVRRRPGCPVGRPHSGAQHRDPGTHQEGTGGHRHPGPAHPRRTVDGQDPRRTPRPRPT